MYVRCTASGRVMPGGPHCSAVIDADVKSSDTICTPDNEWQMVEIMRYRADESRTCPLIREHREQSHLSS